MRAWGFWLTAIGLGLDIIGAGWLTWDLLTLSRSPEKARARTSGGLRSTGWKTLDLLRQSRDAKWGLGCLLLGFLLQLVGASLSYYAPQSDFQPGIATGN